jgi:hypothetical protein
MDIAIEATTSRKIIGTTATSVVGSNPLLRLLIAVVRYGENDNKIYN